MTRFVIQFDDGAFNFGPTGSPKNGFPVGLEEATLYGSIEEAEEKAQDLRALDGSGATIVSLNVAQKR